MTVECASFALPLLIVGLWLGCRRWRSQDLLELALVTATLAAATLLMRAIDVRHVPAIVALTSSLVLAAAALNDVLHGAEPDDGDSGGGGDPRHPRVPQGSGPNPTDWPAFEAAFWSYVRERETRREPLGR